MQAFGGYRDGSGGNPMTDRGYTGHKHNDDLGLIYMNARFYVPGIARFASADTIVPDPTNPQQYNRYSYVLNSPMNFSDPSGHCTQYAGEDGDALELENCIRAWNELGYYFGTLGNENYPQEFMTYLLENATTEDMYSYLNDYGVEYEPVTSKPHTDGVGCWILCDLIDFFDFDAVAIGINGNVDTVSDSAIGGLELVLNWESYEGTLFSYYGRGNSVAFGGGNFSVYIALIGNAEKNSAYKGDFYGADATGAFGHGVVAGRGYAPGDDPLNPAKAHSWYLGYAPGVNASLSVNQTEYIPIGTAHFDRNRNIFEWGAN